MVLPSGVKPCSENVVDRSSAHKTLYVCGNIPKKITRRLSRKRRKARRRRERNNREVKKMAFVEKGPYDYYWRNYFRCTKWVQNHHAAYWKSRVQALEYENCMLRSLLEQNSSCLQSCSGTSLHNGYCRKTKTYVGDKVNNTTSHPGCDGESKVEFDNECCSIDCDGNENTCEHSNNRDIFSDNDRNDEFEFEVDDNMIEFFTQSMKHKLALQRERGEEADDRMTDVNDSDAHRFRKKKFHDRFQKESLENETQDWGLTMGLKKVLPTQCIEQNGILGKHDIQDIFLKKTEREEKEKQKHELFGTSASKILGMETAVQLNFTQVCASKRPTVWPIIPLNL